MKYLSVKNKEAGFSLIEMLVIIAIIGLLATNALANLRDSRESSRDAVIKQQIRATATILEYERNNNPAGTYNTANTLTGTIGNDGSSPDTCANSFDDSFGFEELLIAYCEGIVNQVEYESPFVISYNVNPADGNQFSIMAQLNSGDIYCRGSNGGVYEGPDDPGTGSYEGQGCLNNP